MRSVNKIYKANKENYVIIEEYLKFKKAKKPNITIHGIRQITQSLEKLSHYLQKNTKHKSLRKASKEEMIDFFNKSITLSSWNNHGNNIIPFYRWLEDLDKHTRPSNMKWFESTNARAKQRNNDPHRKDKLLLTTDEYNQIMDYSKDFYGQNKAIWETYYLSGFRPEELTSMNIGDVREDEDNNVWVSCSNSKTYPREIPLPDYPENLIRYIGNHPRKNNKNAPLFFSFNGSRKLTRLNILRVEQRFRKIKIKLKLKPTLNIKSFRKTRATIYFASDDLKINNDTTIAKMMGWSPQTVYQRRQEYNLTNKDDLKNAICKKTMTSISYDTIKSKLDNYESKFEPKIKELEKKNKELEYELKETKKSLDTSREDLKNFKDDIRQKINELSDTKGKFYKNFIDRNINEIKNEDVKRKVKKGFQLYIKKIKNKTPREQIRIINEFIKQGNIPKELEEIDL